jgi:hypothetical protein
VVKSNFRERPEMLKWKISELIGLKRVEIPKHPLRAGACEELEPEMFRWITSELAGRKGVNKNCAGPKGGSLFKLPRRAPLQKIFWKVGIYQ